MLWRAVGLERGSREASDMRKIDGIGRPCCQIELCHRHGQVMVDRHRVQGDRDSRSPRLALM